MGFPTDNIQLICHLSTVVSFSSDGFVLKCGENTDILIKRVEIDGVEYWGDEYVSEFP